MSSSASHPSPGTPGPGAQQFSPEALLDRMERVRALAGHVVRQAADQDDLVQEVVARALAKPTAVVGDAGPWMRRVVKNLAIDRQRSTARRQGRELETVEGERTEESAADSVARAERQRDMVDAVLKLKEPYRAVILARFFDGDPPREIARRQGIPVATVKKHQERGMAMLRKELEGRYGADGAWAVALLPILPKATLKALQVKGLGVVAGALSGSGSGGGAKWLMLGALALAGVSVSALLIRRAGGEPPPHAAEIISLPTIDPDIDAPAPSSATDAPITEGRSSVAMTPSAGSEITPESAIAASLFRGTFVDELGEPISGVRAREIHADDSEGATAIAAEDGALVMDLTKRPNATATVDVRAEGYATASFRLPARTEGAAGEVDVGRQTLFRTTELRVRVVDAEGAVLPDWEMSYFHYGGGERLEIGRAAADPITGTATFRNIAAAHAEVIAEHPSGLSLRHPKRALAAGDAGTIDLVYLGPDPAAHVGVSLHWPQTAKSAAGAPIEVALLENDAVIQTQSVPLGARETAFDDVPPGTFTVRVDDPRLEVAQQEVMPGQSARLALSGNAQIALTLRDTDGEALEDFAVEVRAEAAIGSLVEPAQEGPSSLLGLLPGKRLFVRVFASDGRQAAAEIEPLLPLEVRVLNLTLGDGVIPVRVRALRGASEEPAAGADVALFGVALAADSKAARAAAEELGTRAPRSPRPVLARGTTDQQGEVTLIVASHDVGDALTALVVQGDHATSPVVDGVADVLLLDQGSVRVSVSGLPAEVSPSLGLPAGVALTLTWPGSAPHQSPAFGPGVVLNPLDDETFEAQGVPAGEATVWLALADFNHMGRGTTLGGITGPVGYPLGNFILRPGETTTVDVDVQDVWPGRLDLTASHAGLPLADAVIELEPVGSHAHLPYPFETKKEVSRRLVRMTDGAGRAQLQTLPFGRWRIRVHDPEWLWSCEAGECEIGAGEIRSLDVAIQLAEARVTLVDSVTGEALRSTGVHLEIAPGTWVTRETDASGQLTLRLGPGEYAIAASETGPRTPLSWNVDGPVHATLVLE